MNLATGNKFKRGEKLRGGYTAEGSKHVPIFAFSLTAFKVSYLFTKKLSSLQVVEARPTSSV